MKFVTINLILLFSILASSNLVAQKIGQMRDDLEETSLKLIEIRMAHLNEVPKQSPLLGSEVDIRFELSSELPIHFFQSLVNDKFLFKRAAYISKVKEIVAIRNGFSKAYKARAAFIAPIIPKTDDSIILDNLGIELKIINLNIEVMNDATLLKVQKPQIINQQYQLKTDYSQILYIAGLLFLIAVVIFIYSMIRKKERQQDRAYQEKWRTFILKSKTRNELEKVYLLRRKWKTVLNIKAAQVNSFSRIINKYQYKEQWSLEETMQVRESLESIMKKQGGK